MPEPVNFYSAWYCPFAQRTWAALEHLGIPYKYLETDPYHKSAEWLEISRGMGQVPVLEFRKQAGKPTRITDSLRTLESLDDTQAMSHRLFPENPLDRAEARFWLDHQGKSIIPYFYRYLKANVGSESANEAKEQMLSGLLQLAEGMNSNEPYFMGQDIGIVDFAFAPFALRIELLLSHYKDFSLPTEGEAWVRYGVWWQSIKSHPALLKTMRPSNAYLIRLIEFYLPYSQGGGQDNVTIIP